MGGWNNSLHGLDRPLREALVLVFIFVASAIVAIHLDLAEKIAGWISSQEEYQVDEYIIVLAIFSFFLLCYSLRRWSELRNLLKDKKINEENLKRTNQELSQKTKELEQLQQRNDKLVQLVTFLQVCKTTQEVYQFINEATETLFKGCSGGMYIFKGSRNQLSIVAKWGDTELVEFFAPDDCWGLRLGKPFLSNDDWGTPRCKHYCKGCFTKFCIPLTAYGEILGLFLIQFPPNYEIKNENAVPVSLSQSLTIFTEQISLTISNIRLNEKLKHMAIHDPLTGLYNRQFLKETVERELHRATRNNLQLAILILDIDRFKAFNDTFGHSAGDAVIKSVANFLKQFFRIEDFCCRYGGEEFLILLTDAALEGLEARCDTLRQSVGKLTVTHEGGNLGKVSVSIGVAVFPKNGTTFSQLVDAADKALYRAKQQGRDRVCFS